MTLDLEKFISNSIKTQAKIQHLDVQTKTRKDIPATIKKMITEEYGENYLMDADYVSFFWGPIGKDNIKKLFNVVDRALGKSANKLTDTDFKKIAFEKPSDDVDDADDALDDEHEDDNEDVEVEVDERLDEDDESSSVTQKTNYFFLKITLK